MTDIKDDPDVFLTCEFIESGTTVRTHLLGLKPEVLISVEADEAGDVQFHLTVVDMDTKDQLADMLEVLASGLRLGTVE